MKVSDDIRKKAHELGGHIETPVTARELYGLADRIDAETMELPKDMDGAPIHVWDTVWDVRDEQELSVIGIAMCAHDVRLYVTPDGTAWWHVSPIHITHERPDSLERIADELDERAGSLAEDGYTWQEDAIHDFADRIRKLATKEGTPRHAVRRLWAAVRGEHGR